MLRQQKQSTLSSVHAHTSYYVNTILDVLADQLVPCTRSSTQSKTERYPKVFRVWQIMAVLYIWYEEQGYKQNLWVGLGTPGLYTSVLIYDIQFLINDCQLQGINTTTVNILKTGTNVLILYAVNIVLISVFMESVTEINFPFLRVHWLISKFHVILLTT
jgi:hypothetical protein